MRDYLNTEGSSLLSTFQVLDDDSFLSNILAERTLSFPLSLLEPAYHSIHNDNVQYAIH